MSSSNSNEVSLSIEETNKLRLSLGLKPLIIDDGPATSSAEPVNEAKQEHQRWLKEKDRQETDKKSQEILDKIFQSREQRKLQTKLRAVKTLGEESDEEVDDAAAWINRSRRKAEELALAAKIEKEQEELEAAQAAQNQKRYGAKDIANLKVEHDIQDFAEGKQVILTLKDSKVLDDGEDTLENVNIVDQEKSKKNLLSKARSTAYTAYDDDEFDEYGRPKIGAKALLRQYDEVIDGEKKQSFTLGAAQDALDESNPEVVRRKLQDGLVSLGPALPNRGIQQEYFTEEEMLQFKKGSKKPRKLRKKTVVRADDLIPLSENNQQDHVDGDIVMADPTSAPTANNTVDENEIFGADDFEEDALEREMRASLARARLAAMEKSKMAREAATDDAAIEESEYVRKLALEAAADQEQLASKVKQENADGQDDAMGAQEEEEEEEDHSHVYSATTEFVRLIGMNAEVHTEAPGRRYHPVKAESSDDEEAENGASVRIKEEGSQVDNSGWKTHHVEDEDEDGVVRGSEDVNVRPLEDEPLASGGLAAVLALAKKRGFVEKGKQPANTPQLEADPRRQADRGMGRRPESNPLEKPGYVPSFEINYTDDYGRKLNEKEAFKHLSHQFHGKNPGHAKQEKIIRKMLEEQERNNAARAMERLGHLQEKQRDQQSAHLVLRTGTRDKEVTSMELEKKVISKRKAGEQGAVAAKKKYKKV